MLKLLQWLWFLTSFVVIHGCTTSGSLELCLRVFIKFWQIKIKIDSSEKSLQQFCWNKINKLVSNDWQLTIQLGFNPITSRLFYSGRCRGDRFCPTCLIFLKCGFLGFWWNHLQTVYDSRSHAKRNSQKFKIEDFIAIWRKKSSIFEKILSRQKSS